MTIPNRQLGTIPSEVNGVFQVYFGVQIPNQQVFGSLVCFFFRSWIWNCTNSLQYITKHDAFGTSQV